MTFKPCLGSPTPQILNTGLGTAALYNAQMNIVWLFKKTGGNDEGVVVGTIKVKNGGKSKLNGILKLCTTGQDLLTNGGLVVIFYYAALTR